MGQYFVIANLDKKEYIRPTLLKLHEICANNDCRVLPYLLADGDKYGTPLMMSTTNMDEVPEGWEVYERNEKFGYVILVKKTKYFGRWCGDRIVVAGDYGLSGIWASIENNKEWRNITKEVFEEFNEFIQNDELKAGEVSRIYPDLVLTAGGVKKHAESV